MYTLSLIVRLGVPAFLALWLVWKFVLAVYEGTKAEKASPAGPPALYPPALPGTWDGYL